jgi:competence protein ComEC
VLCLALLVQLVITPGVIRSLGFQLSYLAMAGIVLLYPVLEKWYPEGGSAFNPIRKIWQMAAIAISCQLFTGPLAWIKFGTFPRHFLLTNLLAIPVVTALMWVSVITIALYGLGWCPGLLITITDGLSRLLVWILTVISS